MDGNMVSADAVVVRWREGVCEQAVDTVAEEEGHLNPVWVVTFPFVDEAEAMEQRLSAILQAHDAELQSVYAAIVDKKDDYCEQ